MLPFDYQGRIAYPYPDLADSDGFIDRLLRRISAMLVDLKLVSTMLLTKGELVFEVPMVAWVWTDWNLLLGITRGRIHVDYRNGSLNLLYWVSFKRMLIVATIAVLILGVIVLVQAAPPLVVAFVFIVGWLWLFGMGVVIFLIRFNSFLKRGIRQEVRWEQKR